MDKPTADTGLTKLEEMGFDPISLASTWAPTKDDEEPRRDYYLEVNANMFTADQIALLNDASEQLNEDLSIRAAINRGVVAVIG